MEALKKCTRNGCKKQFKETENDEQSCKFHPGKPIFHDLKKGWTCCNVIVYDWEEFEKIKPCAVGFHNETDNSTGSEFFKSNTVQNAQKGLEKFGNGDQAQQPRKIEDYTKEQEAKRLKETQQIFLDASKEKKIFVSPKGLYKCTNKGCMKEYDPNDQSALSEEACNFHSGNPIFHDLKKYWTCCNKETYDWDDFMKLPTCSKGKHIPKMV